jgi:two-component system cell cycle response regulator
MPVTVQDKQSTPRASLRQRRLKAAQIIFKDNSSILDCLVRDWSDTGAKLKCSQAHVVPKHFSLLLKAEWLLYPAELRWRRGDELGIKFTGPATVPPMKRV